MSTKLLLTCNNSIEANLIKTKLDDSEIFCFLTNENFSSIMPQYFQMLGSGVRVMVNEEDFNDAVEILGLNDKSEVKCPECNSANISSALGKGKFKKIITIILSLFILSPISNIRVKYICRDCKNEFEK